MSFYPASASDATATGTQGGGPGGDHDAGLDGGGSAAAALACGGAVMVAVRVEDLIWPVRDGGQDDRSGLVVAGTEKIRSGDDVVWLKVVAVTPAVVRRDGRVQADGRPCDHARLGVLEEQLNASTGCPDAIGHLAASVSLKGTKVKAAARRVMSVPATIRAVLLMTAMPDADYQEIMTTLFGDLAYVPWKRRFTIPSPTVLSTWRAAIGPAPLKLLQDRVFAAADAEHRVHDYTAVDIGGGLRLGSIDGCLTRTPDTDANRTAFGSTGTTDDSAPYPQLRHLHISDASTRATLGVVTGPAGTDKAEAEQALLDRALIEYAFIFTRDRCWVMDRNFPGVTRIKRILATGTHVLIRIKSDITLTRISDFFPDGSYLAIVSGGGEQVTMRVIEYLVQVAGRQAPDMFALITDLTDHQVHPAHLLAAAYRWRWDGSETALREAKSLIRGAGPSTGAILRSTTPELIAQEHAAWMCATELVHALTRAAARAATPISKGSHAGQNIQPRQISFTTARRTAITTIRSTAITTIRTGPATTGLPAGSAAYRAALTTIGKARVQTDRNRHRDRKVKTRQPFANAPRDISTVTAPAHLHLCGVKPQAA